MVSRPIDYEVLAQYAGEYLLEALRDPIKIGSGERVPNYRVAVYVALGLSGEVLYVGSVVRPEDSKGMQARLSEHLRHKERFQQWDTLILFPLRSDTPLVAVRRIEGRIGAHLRPSMSRALPQLNPRRRHT